MCRPCRREAAPHGANRYKRGCRCEGVRHLRRAGTVTLAIWVPGARWEILAQSLSTGLVAAYTLALEKEKDQ